ncbi:patatin-like phospholipase family protein [Novosphingobium aquiterrae]|uniref:Patatin-like phospholipase family protein n=1 Tax=Novosphingobium aquiterrae TaxID=624388 RepID=A0ABV6PEM2_9SPHN
MTELHDELAARGQIVLVFQGGGALGAYQAGVYEALHEAGIEPDWVVGTSIGAINAALIAGSPRGERVARLSEFWDRVSTGKFMGLRVPDWLGLPARNMATIMNGLPAFFRPRPMAFVNPFLPLGGDAAAYYSVDPLRELLGELIDFDQINRGAMRLSVGAAKVQSAEMIYFDSEKEALSVEHVLASGALPPAFPAVRIDGELYWDGGILSNTPVEIVFDDEPRQSATVFAVHLWNPHGPEPDSIWQVMNRQKDLQYCSRAAQNIKRQRQLHRLRHVVTEIAKLVPDGAASANHLAELRGYGCDTRMNVVRLLAPSLDNEDHSKDIDFSPNGIRLRREAGYRHTIEALALAPWRNEINPLDGLVLHEVCGGEIIRTTAAA